MAPKSFQIRPRKAKETPRDAKSRPREANSDQERPKSTPRTSKSDFKTILGPLPGSGGPWAGKSQAQPSQTRSSHRKQWSAECAAGATPPTTVYRLRNWRHFVQILDDRISNLGRLPVSNLLRATPSGDQCSPGESIGCWISSKKSGISRASWSGPPFSLTK